MTNVTDNLNLVEIDNAIEMLKTYATEDCIKPIISTLEALQKDPGNEALLAQLAEIWRNLGIYQGTVLTYVPYFFTLIPDDIFGDDVEK